MPVAYYNEIDPYCVQWLNSLMNEGLIPPGVVDSRPIQEVIEEDLEPYTQCHFFAGLGGWPRALRMAGWPDDRPVWTGSCPCQPFSGAGRRRGTSDERHLWPFFERLISYCAPAIVYGEQVASKDGKVWLSGVRADLEELGYGVGTADLCAAGTGAPHIRQRLYWMATLRLGHTVIPRLEGRELPEVAGDGGRTGERAAGAAGADDRLAISEREGEGRRGIRGPIEGKGADGKWASGQPRRRGAGDIGAGFWSDYALVGPDPQNRYRRVKPGVRLLASGIPSRVAKLRAFGNAIVPPLAAEFILASLEAINDMQDEPAG